jgi:hypothetical protein
MNCEELHKIIDGLRRDGATDEMLMAAKTIEDISIQHHLLEKRYSFLKGRHSKTICALRTITTDAAESLAAAVGREELSE